MEEKDIVTLAKQPIEPVTDLNQPHHPPNAATPITDNHENLANRQPLIVPQADSEDQPIKEVQYLDDRNSFSNSRF